MTDAELLDAYRRTVWTIRTPGGPVEFRSRAAAPFSAELLPVGIVTAFNPGSSLRTAEWNHGANGRLELRLRRLGARYLPALAAGTGADAGRWDEPGFAWPRAARAALIHLAGEFGQNAVVWVDRRGRPALVVTRPGFCGMRPGDTLEL